MMKKEPSSMTSNPTNQPQRELLNHWQRKTLTQLVRSFRREGADEWQMAGIEKAIVRAEQTATRGVDVAAAAITAAAMDKHKTPGMIPRAGLHWPPDDEGERKAPPRPTFTACAEHSTQPAYRCALCPQPVSDPLREDLKAALRARLAESKAVRRETDARLSGRLR